MAKGRKSQRRDDRRGGRRVAAAPERKRSSGPKRSSTFSFGSNELIFGKFNYLVMGGGIGLIVLGLILMTGGAMEDPNVWDETVIYSTRRITIAPILMMLGFAVVGYGIFASPKDVETVQESAE